MNLSKWSLNNLELERREFFRHFQVFALRDYNGSKFTDLGIKIADAAISTVMRIILTTIAFAAEAIIFVDVVFANFDLIRQCCFFRTTVVAMDQASNTDMASGTLLVEIIIN